MIASLYYSSWRESVRNEETTVHNSISILAVCDDDLDGESHRDATVPPAISRRQHLRIRVRNHEFNSGKRLRKIVKER